jgi:ABC-type nitrate/sulfonate/bicarbonate transport system ATPase subunit
MRQRLALLRTCLPGRPVLLLDEPFGALDAITRRRMNAWLAGLDLAGHGRSDGAGRAVVLVTHDVDEALLLADRVVVLSERPGRVVLDLPVPRGEPDAARHALLDALDPQGRARTA